MKRYSRPDFRESPIPNPQSLAPGFTLVEMLVVITIIGILASLITAAAIQARRTTKNAVIVVELKQLEMALQSYKEKFGEYPPDGTDQAAITRHLAKAFPRADIDIDNSGSELNPFTSLTFWLGGVWDDVNQRFIGFSANPTDPFDGSASRIGPFFEFDPNRRYVPGITVTVTNNITGAAPTIPVFRYWPQGAVGDQSAGAGAGTIAYFRAENSDYALGKAWSDANPDPGDTSPTPGVVYPAVDTRLSNTWINPRSFQIFSSGLNVRYGPVDASSDPGLMFPRGDNYEPHTFDDITNFSGRTLESAMP